jgi:hypothetical protein
MARGQRPSPLRNERPQHASLESTRFEPRCAAKTVEPSIRQTSCRVADSISIPKRKAARLVTA